MAMLTTFIAWTVIDHGALLLARLRGRAGRRAGARRGRRAGGDPAGRGRAAAQRGHRHPRAVRRAAGALASVVFGNRYRSFPPAFGDPRLRGRRPHGRCSPGSTCSPSLVVARGDGACSPCCSGSPTSACGCAPRRSSRRWRGCSACASAGCSRSGWALAVAGRLAGRAADRRRQLRAPRLHGLGARLRLHRRGARRAGQPARRGRRRPAARARAQLRVAATSASSWWRWARSRS